MLRFPFDEKKALEAVVLVAKAWPGITPFYAAKIFFLADKNHLSRYGRPVVGDRYIAMQNGPVPSVIYDWFKGNLDLMEDPAAISDAVEFNHNRRPPTATAKRAADLSYFSPSDVAALEQAVAFCRGKDFGYLSSVTHRDPSWQAANLNCEMDPLLMIEGDQRESLVLVAEEFAQYGVA
ncbi:Panacea domain-containing protein [Aquibaculum sediminis]|uniref:Panacea domain-containing protein n=1 Tax=Aquibaculum sediminis TaxID=3231907 RepID=UPI003455BB62